MARSADPTRARTGAVWIVRTLRDHGHIAYFAGGCVRDALLGLHPTDYDVATDAIPQRVRELFPRTAEVGAAFGVVLVHVPGEHCDSLSTSRGPGVTVEVATFRSDGPYSDSRRPDMVRFSDPLNDAQRRDFTINALFADPLSPEGKDAIIDFVGGVADLEQRVVRAVGDPDKRLAEDHLRALRAVRFAARLGFVIEPATRAAITRHSAELRGVSRERIGEELRRILAHPSRAAALRMLESLQLDAPVLEEACRESELKVSGALGASVRISTVLAAWCVDRASEDGPTVIPRSDIPGVVRRLRKALCLSNEEAADFGNALDQLAALKGEWVAAPHALKKRLASKPSFEPALQILRQVHPDIASQVERDVEVLEKDGIGLHPEPLVTGDDLVSSGMTPGPGFKGVLDGVYDAQLEGRVGNKTEAMELAARLHV